MPSKRFLERLLVIPAFFVLGVLTMTQNGAVAQTPHVVVSGTTKIFIAPEESGPVQRAA